MWPNREGNGLCVLPYLASVVYLSFICLFISSSGNRGHNIFWCNILRSKDNKMLNNSLKLLFLQHMQEKGYCSANNTKCHQHYCVQSPWEVSLSSYSLKTTFRARSTSYLAESPPKQQPSFSPNTYRRLISPFGHGLPSVMIRPVATEADRLSFESQGTYLLFAA